MTCGYVVRVSARRGDKQNDAAHPGAADGGEVGRLMDLYLAMMPPADRIESEGPRHLLLWDTRGHGGGRASAEVSVCIVDPSQIARRCATILKLCSGAPHPSSCSVSTFTPLDPAVQQALESTAAALSGERSETQMKREELPGGVPDRRDGSRRRRRGTGTG